MEGSAEQPKFDIQPVIEQKPFQYLATQRFFTKWCEINDSIQPEIVGRKDWGKKRLTGLLEQRPDGKQTLFIPTDLHLWEMMGVIEAIDQDTFSKNPEKQNQNKEKLISLGRTFQNSGVYIAQRLNSIGPGREIATALAEEFYNYGLSLESGKKPDDSATVNDFKYKRLSRAETEEIDQFLAGESLYKSRQDRAEKAASSDPNKNKLSYFLKHLFHQKDEYYESERRRTLAQFFGVAERAFQLENPQLSFKARVNEFFHLFLNSLTGKEEVRSVHSAFLKNVREGINQKAEIPMRELGRAIFRRGMELLQRNMPFDKLPDYLKKSVLHWQDGEQTLREALQIDKLRTELEIERRRGNKQKISAKEREIADRIQKAVSKYPYLEHANKPADMVANQNINCVGASTLGGALMKEAGLNYLVVGLLGHSILFLITSDGGVEWRDLINSSYGHQLNDQMIRGATISDILTFSRDPKALDLRFEVVNPIFMNGRRSSVVIYKSEVGHEIQILHNTAISLSNLTLTHNAIEAYKQMSAIDPNMAEAYSGLGFQFKELGHNQEALAFYRRTIAIDPKLPDPYYGMGNIYQKLGRKQEAIAAYQKYAELADPQENARSIRQAKRWIATLSSE